MNWKHAVLNYGRNHAVIFFLTEPKSFRSEGTRIGTNFQRATRKLCLYVRPSVSVCFMACLVNSSTYIFKIFFCTCEFK